MIWTLYKLEIFKMLKRPAARIAYACFAAIVLFSSGSAYYDSLQNEKIYLGFPDAWPYIFMFTIPAVNVFSMALIILLIATEFDWRTSRQNVIDGLSKGQWFLIKLMLMPTVVLFFYCPLIIYDCTFAWLMTDAVRQEAFEISSVQYLALLGTLTGILCYSSLAFMIAMTVRSAGVALGITIVYPLFDGTITKTLRGVELDTIADFFPIEVMGSLFNYNQYNVASPWRPSREWDTSMLFITGILWITLFVLLTWLVYRKRDL